PPGGRVTACEDVLLLELRRGRFLARIYRQLLRGVFEVSPAQKEAVVSAGVPLDRADEQPRVCAGPFEVGVECARELGESCVAVVAVAAPDPVQLAQPSRRSRRIYGGAG